MSRQLAEIESLLQRQVEEHQKLLGYLEAQQKAMRAFDLKAMDAAQNLQEACRLRITSLEAKRRMITTQLARVMKIEEDKLTLTRIAEVHPARKDSLLKLRDQLKQAIAAIQKRTHVAGKLAVAVLGHLNTVVRLLAGAVEQAGVYTKHGVPQVASRIGVLEAVG